MAEASVGTELMVAQAAIIAALVGDTDEADGGLMTLSVHGAPVTGVFNTVAPQDKPAPYIIVSLQSPGADDRALCDDIVMASPTFLVRAVAFAERGGPRPDLASLDPLARRIHRVLHKLRATVDSYPVYVRRESPYQDILSATETGGRAEYYAGGFYTAEVLTGG
jgi:hypothetical protein